jgi:hypothetical protein
MPQPDEDRLEDWVAETNESIAARLDGVKAAQSQTRVTLAAMAIVSVMMLIASYNAYLSYDYNWIVEQKCPKSGAKADNGNGEGKPDDSGKESDNNKDLTKLLTGHAMEEWASSRTVMISLLGIRVSVDDVSVLGTAVLLLLSLWLLLVARRENHTTGFLLRDTDERDGGGAAAGARAVSYTDRKRWLIYHTVISNSLFVTFDYLRNVDRLDGPNSLEAGTQGEERGRLRSFGLAVAREFFFLFPVVVTFVIFILDCVSYYYDYLPDPFSPNCKLDPDSAFFIQSRIIFFVCFLPLLICCLKSRGLSKNTEKVLHEYGTKLLSDLKEKSRPPEEPRREPSAAAARRRRHVRGARGRKGIN